MPSETAVSTDIIYCGFFFFFFKKAFMTSSGRLWDTIENPPKTQRQCGYPQHAFIPTAKPLPSSHRRSVWMLLGQCSTIASLPKKPQLHFLFTERVSVTLPIHKCCIGHYKKEQPILNPYTRLQKHRYLMPEFLESSCCYVPFCSRGGFSTCRMAGGRLKHLPATAGLIHCLQPTFNSL